MTWSITSAAITVGTSLSSNLRGLEQASSFEDWISGQPLPEQSMLRAHRRYLTDAAVAARNGRWEDAGQYLARMEQAGRVLGAEVASLNALLQSKRFAGIRRLWLLSSATGEGQGSAAMIERIASLRYGTQCKTVSIENLTHERFDRFRIVGLRNLVSALAEIIGEVSARQLVIDATGGYKAQTAIATVVGLAFGVPVVYRFEEFPNFIELPPLPVTIDDSLVPENLDIFRRDTVPRDVLVARFGEPLNESNPGYAQFRVYVSEPVQIDREEYFEVSPLGQLLYERWRLSQRPQAPSLPPAPHQRGPNWGDHHWPSGVDAFARGLLAQHPWIKRIDTRSAKGRSHENGVSYRFEHQSTGVPPIECTYVSDNFPAVLVLKTTASSVREQEDVLRWLDATNERKSRPCNE